MPKIEVAWTALTEDGEKCQFCARTEGDRWVFLRRGGRFDNWTIVAQPPLEDWLRLLDGVRRRGSRGLASNRDESRLLAHVRRLYPGERVE